MIILELVDTSLRMLSYIFGYIKVSMLINVFKTFNIPFRYETSDGVSRTEEAELKNAGTENEILVVRGTISWFAPDGQQYTISFIADENGYQPEGAHLPKA